MIIKHLVTGPLQVNTYIVGDEVTKEAVVIDPGGSAGEILRLAEREGLTLRRIINTHAHFDHIGGVQDLKDLTGIPFALHEADLPILQEYSRQLLYFGLPPKDPPEVDEYLQPGDEIAVGEVRLEVLFTPGHSPGHVTFVAPGVAFVGDVLFQGGIGRFDLPGGDYEQLMKSIREVLLPLGDDTVVYPGHGPATTIGQERLYNPFL
jgi:glyoxylase-like metal-dependent hydrolase (beta-lactamase superfamily II)